MIEGPAGRDSCRTLFLRAGDGTNGSSGTNVGNGTRMWVMGEPETGLDESCLNRGFLYVRKRR